MQLTYSLSPSISSGGKSGTRLSSRLALPFAKRITILWLKCRMASDSSWPVCLASADPNLLTRETVWLCQPQSPSLTSDPSSFSTVTSTFWSTTSSWTPPGRLRTHSHINLWTFKSKKTTVRACPNRVGGSLTDQKTWKYKCKNDLKHTLNQ